MFLTNKKLFLCALFMGLVMSVSGCAKEEGAMEKAGKKLDEAAEDIGDAAEDMKKDIAKAAEDG